MTVSNYRYSGPIGSLAGGLINISQSHDDFHAVTVFRVRVAGEKRVTITDEEYMTAYPEMTIVDRVVTEGGLQLLMEMREKIDEAIANTLGGRTLQ